MRVVQSEVGGWDVVDEDGMALSNHASRETAERAAHLRRGGGSGAGIEVDPGDTRGVDDESRGVRTAALALAGLLALVMVLVVALALTGSLTDFGA